MNFRNPVKICRLTPSFTDGSHGHLQVLGDLDVLNFTNFRITGLEYLMSPTTLVTYTGGLSGEIFFLEDFLLPEGYEIDYGTGFDSSISIIPEPSTYALFSVILVVLFMLRRRRAASQVV